MKKITLLVFLVFVIKGFSQDSCDTATNVTVGTYSVSAIDGDPAPQNCAGVYSNGDNGEWYEYTPSMDYSLTVTTDLAANSGSDTRFHIYTGDCQNLVCVGGDDDSGDGLLSTLTVNVYGGQTYYIVFDDHWEDTGFSFELIEQDFQESLLSFTNQPLNPSPQGNTLAVVDMNGDYFDDVVSISNTNVNIIFQSASSTGFTEINIPTNPVANNPSWSLAIADFDKNGQNDLLYGGGSGVTFMKANDTGDSFSEISGSEYVFSQRSNFVDINLDGHLDAFVCHDVEPNVYYMNDGAGNLSFNQGGLGDVPSGGNYGSIWIDYDNDGDSDLFLAKCRGGGSPASINELHQNNGDGTFTDVSTTAGLADPVQTWSSAWADFDNNGYMDVFIGASSFSDGEHKLMYNNGDGTFTDITLGSGIENIDSTGRENVAFDFNNDGYVDIFGIGGKILLNNGDLTFTNAGVSINAGPVGDLNNDGFLDIVNGGSIHTNQPNTNNWIKIGLLGNVSNINGIGARVEVHSNLGVQIRDIKSGIGFEFMSTLNAHFGIGEDTAITKVVVKWPSGIIDEVDNPTINTTLVIEENSQNLSVGKNEVTKLSIYPNPASDYLTISSKFEIIDSKYEIYNNIGQLQKVGKINDGSQISVEALSSGTYILKITAEEKSFQQKFVKR